MNIENIKHALGNDSLTPAALAEKLGCTLEELVLAIVDNGKVRLGAQPGTIEFARRGRPAGRSAKVTERVEKAKDAILELRGTGATVADVVARAEVESRDVKTAAAELAEAGEITQVKRGRELRFVAPINMGG
jgi:hypothetical protein